ncbi:dihydroxyacetone kinase phosphoryl donor subunit DhaM [Nocardiopsis coralliicola]
MDATVGIVLVSHSAKLAEGVVELLGQLGAPEGAVVGAGGGPDGGIGTDPERVAAALRSAERGAGVVVLADIGSAVLTARLALEDGGHPGAVLVDAPFVEGAVAAGVLLRTGADRETVAAAAREASSIPKFSG